MKVSFHMETLDAAWLFRQRLDELSKKADLSQIRGYILEGKNYWGLPENICREADEVFAIRRDAISREMHAHGAAQAKLSGVELAEEILNGTSLAIGYPDLKDTVPTSRVYELFMPYSVKERDFAEQESSKPENP